MRTACCRHEFLRETSWLAGLRDPNLARVVGLCSQDEPMCALLEHSDPGDLPRFLAQRAVSEDGNQVGPTIRSVGTDRATGNANSR
jgi:discoidin domain receptor family protein 2